MYGPQNPISQEVHKTKYRSHGETFEDGINRNCAVLADNPEHYHQIRDICLNMRFMMAGRNQAAIGSSKQITPYNCFVSNTIDDSMDGIMKTLQEAAETMRMGGGIGYDFSTLRPRGSMIRKLDSQTGGPIPFMGIYNALCKTIASSGHRRGAQMAVMRIDHPDIQEYINAKHDKTSLTAFNTSIAITDEFMEAVEADAMFNLQWDGITQRSIRAVDLWEQIMRSTYDYAEPGVLFIDRINEENNLWYCETIAATNPCLHPDTLVETTEGRIRIADMTRSYTVYCKDNEGNLTTAKASPSWISKKNAKTVKVIIDSGKELICTPDHLIFTINRGWIEAQYLTVNDRVGHLMRTKKSEKYSRVKLNVNKSEQYISEHRFVADAVYGVTEFEDVHHKDGNTFNNHQDNLEVLSHDNHSVLTNTGKNKSSMIKNPDGTFAKITYKQKAENISMPEELKSNLANQYSGKVISIEDHKETDVYDITVEDYHNFIANFIVVHNCAEQPLPPYGACLLGSFNIVKYLIKTIRMNNGAEYIFNWSQLAIDIYHIIRMMDNVVDNAIYPLPQQEVEAKNKRRMGIGVTGLANAVEALGMPYGSKEAVAFTEKLLGYITKHCYKASIILAQEKGPFPLFDKEKYGKNGFVSKLDKDILDDIYKYGIRNSHLTSIAPTGTISVCADNVSSGIEPVIFHEQIRQYVEFGKVSQLKFKDYGLAYLGVRGKTIEDVTIDEHLDMLIAAQKHIDSSISKTCNVPYDIEWETFKNVYMRAWKEGCKGCTTYRQNAERDAVITKSVEEQVIACEYNPTTGMKTCE